MAQLLFIGALPRGWDVKGVLGVSLIDVNCRLWSHFKGVWDGKWLYLPIQVSLKAVHKEINTKMRWHWLHDHLKLTKEHDVPGTTQIYFSILVFFKGGRATPTLISFSGLTNIPVTFIWVSRPLACYQDYAR